MEEDDMEAVRKAAEHIRIPFNRHEIFNRLSQLSQPKAKMKQALKERMKLLAAAYISLATFIDDDEVEFIFENRDSQRAKDIAARVCDDLDRSQQEMRDFKLVE
ncbi:MAG: hypothetical protein K2X81_19455 [Candidatus Obscuribacterales bacterium]|nr:hypothetical protein [Candidatus Obscuribacterales bacterium]